MYLMYILDAFSRSTCILDLNKQMTKEEANRGIHLLVRGNGNRNGETHIDQVSKVSIANFGGIPIECQVKARHFALLTPPQLPS